MARGRHYAKLSLSNAARLSFSDLCILLFLFLSLCRLCVCAFLCSHWSLVDVPLIFFCPADHVPDWQPRVLLGMVEARSVNVKKTTTGSAVPTRVSLLISILRLNLVLTYGIPTEFRGGVHLFVETAIHTPSGQSRVYRVTQLRTDGVHCRESAGTGPVVLKVVPVTGAAILQVTMD